MWLFKRRRDLGVAAFLYALLHLAAYALKQGNLSMILADFGTPGIVLGWLTPSEFANRNVQDKQRLLGAASQGSAPIAVASTAQQDTPSERTQNWIRFQSKVSGNVQTGRISIVRKNSGQVQAEPVCRFI